MNSTPLADIKAIKLKSPTGFCVEVITFGAIITKIMAKDKDGHRDNVVLEYETIDDYLSNPLFLGCVVGPVAGRTSKGQINLPSVGPLKGRKLTLDTSCHPNSLHSCEQGLHKVNWEVKSQTTDRLILTHETSIYPDQSGRLRYTLTYEVQGESLTIDYHVTSTELTYLSLTNHSYFNLSGQPTTPIFNHQLQLNCSHHALLDSESLPIELVPMAHSSFDFTNQRALKDVLSNGGIDHPFKCQSSESVAVLTDPDTGRIMQVATSQPYMVIYTGNFLDAAVSPSGKRFIKHAGICFETQDLPSVTTNGLDKSIYVTEQAPYSHRTTFSFSTL